MISKLYTIISNKLWYLSLYFGDLYNRWVLASQQKALGPCKCARFCQNSSSLYPGGFDVAWMGIWTNPLVSPGVAPQGEDADWCIKRESPLDVRLHNYDLVPRAFSLKKWVGREKALCEKLKLCVTSRRAILGGLLYLLTINEKFYEISFLSQTLAMVIFCFPLISMKGTASNIWKTSVYRAV